MGLGLYLFIKEGAVQGIGCNFFDRFQHLDIFWRKNGIATHRQGADGMFFRHQRYGGGRVITADQINERDAWVCSHIIGGVVLPGTGDIFEYVLFRQEA